MDVGAWLRALGLGQYETTFRESEIDAEVLPDLTEGDLNQLGVPLGHRKRLLKAIAALRTGETTAKPPSPAPATAERRPITVMFCDLVGSTGLAAKLDAEDWRTLVNTYLDEASAAVTGLGGHVLKKLGDGLMALFGYPHAQENDAERAVRAALSIQRALVEINARNASRGTPELAARIGLDSGQVVVDATGEVFGDAPNIAARVQSAAGPGSILITAAVQRQTAGLFVAEDHGQHELKGLSAPMTLYRVVRASGGGRRGGARVLTPLVGREEELDLLTRRWERAHKGEGQLALIVGEPGLGKSRLMEEFHGRLGETPHTWVEWSSSQLLQNTPLHPIAEWGRQRFGADLTAEQRLADLENTLGLIGLDPAEYAPLLAPLVDVLLPEDKAAKFAPEELRRRQLAAMTAWILAAARTQAVVLAFEDLHWADPTSLDLMRALAERGAQAPLLIIATARPEFRPPWSVRSHHSAISLSPLDRVQITKMVAELSAHHGLPRDIVEGVSERTGGVPLFVEEVTRLLLERGEQGGARAIPPTLQQSLAARLDRLGAARETAQIGAVLGRGFSYALLQSVAGLDEGALQSALERLAQADILFVEGDGPQATYRFKHALIQDAAYDSLLKSRRQVLHRRAAEILRESASPEPEAIAHHFTQAGVDDLAIEWWGKAGDQALRRSAFQEAIAHLGKAIAMADEATGAASRPNAGDATASRQRVKLQAGYSEAVMYHKGFSAEETRVAWARAAELGANRDDFSERSSVRHGQWTLAIVRGELHAAQALASTFLREAEDARRPVEAGVARRSLGIICYYFGDFLNARIHCERALNECRHERDLEARERFSDDTGAVAMSILAITSWQLGEVERANELINMANHRAAELGHAPSKVHPLYWKSILEILRGDAAAALITAKALEDLCGEHGMGEWGTVAEMVVGWAHGRLANPTEGAAEMRQALAVLINKGGRLLVAFFQGLLADLELETLGADSAVARIDEALVSADQATNFASLPFLHRLRGDILLKRNPPNIGPAEDAYRTAIAIAKRQGARSYELLSSLSLAKLDHSTGRLVEAQAVLGPALEGFAPTPEMPEIAEAQALLDGLGATDAVKAAADSRRQRVHLQTSYGKALIGVHGYGAPETALAFERARELATGLQAAGLDDSIDRFAATYGVWVGTHVRGELLSMRELAATFLRESASRPNSGEASVGHRIMGATHWFAAEFVEARAHLEQAVAIFDPSRDADLAFRYGQDIGVSASGYSAIALWPLGEIDLSWRRADDAVTRARSSGHVATAAYGLALSAIYRLLIRDPEGAQPIAAQLGKAAEDLQSPQHLAFYDVFGGWPAWLSGSGESALLRIRRGVAQLKGQGIRTWAPLTEAMLAEVESEAGDSDSAMVTIARTIAEAERLGQRWYDAELHRIRGEILLKRPPSVPAPAEEAFLTAIAIAQRQKTRSFELRAALSLAKLYQSTGRLGDAHTVLAPALEGFAPTPEMREIAEAQALLAALAKDERIREALEKRQVRAKMHRDYARAVQWAKGWGTEEARAAVERAHEFAVQTPGDADYWSLTYGRFAVSLLRGEFHAALEIAETYLRRAEVEERPDHAVNAHRLLGTVKLELGAFLESRQEFEKLLQDWDEDRDKDLRAVTGADVLCVGWSYMAQLMMILGEVDDAVRMSEGAIRRAESLGDFGSLAFALGLSLFVLAMCGRNEATLRRAEAFEANASEKGARLWESIAREWASWGRGLITGDVAGAATELRDIMAARRERQERQSAYMGHGVLAQLQGKAGAIDAALASIAEGLALAEQTSGHRADSFLHRVRGDVLAEREPAAAEAAYREALRIARSQGARTFELQAAHALAKLLNAATRPVEAQAVLAPALEGFAPTPKMPEIADAQALLAALAETEEVKADAARRQQRRQLQVAYGNALIGARGHGAPETIEAFAKARESAYAEKDAPERFAADYGLYAGAYTHGELPQARAYAETLLRNVADRPNSPEAGVARRAVGLTRWFAGEYREAQDHLERALALFQPGRDDDLAFRFGWDAGVGATIYLAIVLWPMGDVERAVSLVRGAQTRIAGLSHIGTHALGNMHAALFELMRGNLSHAAPNAVELARIAREHDLPMWRAFGLFLEGAATTERRTLGEGLTDMRRGVERMSEENDMRFAGLIKIVLAEAEARAGDIERAVAVLDEALATCERIGHRAFEAELHRARGDILLQRDPVNSAPAEEAFLTAIAVARHQATRSFELRAALALAKLFQSTGRAAEADAVLAPALEGFSPMPEMPEIAQAQALLVAIEAGAHVRHQ